MTMDTATCTKEAKPVGNRVPLIEASFQPNPNFIKFNILLNILHLTLSRQKGAKSPNEKKRERAKQKTEANSTQINFFDQLTKNQ